MATEKDIITDISRPTEDKALYNMAARYRLIESTRTLSDHDWYMADKEINYILSGLDPVDAIKAVAQDVQMPIEHVLVRLSLISQYMLIYEI